MKERTRRAQVGLAVAHAGVLHLYAHIVARLVPAGQGETSPCAVWADMQLFICKSGTPMHAGSCLQRQGA